VNLVGTAALFGSSLQAQLIACTIRLPTIHDHESHASAYLYSYNRLSSSHGRHSEHGPRIKGLFGLHYVRESGDADANAHEEEEEEEEEEHTAGQQPVTVDSHAMPCVRHD
jgi:hypothetical protein